MPILISYLQFLRFKLKLSIVNITEKINTHIDQISPYDPGKPIEAVAEYYGIDANDIIKLASNESALGVSPAAVKAIRNNAELCFRYPEGSAHKLRIKIAKKFDVLPDQIIMGNGSNEILTFIGHCFMNSETSTVSSEHSFAVYKMITELYDARSIQVPMTKDLVLDIYKMVDAIESDTSVIFICNPNNPTGTMIKNKDLESAIEKIPEDVLVVIDEAYAEIALETMPESMRYVAEKTNVIICRTFSKAYGLAGLRLGYGMGPVNLIQALQKARQPFNVNLIAQIAGTAAIDDDEFVDQSKRVYRDAKLYMEELCNDLNLNYIPTTTNFMLIKVGNGAEVAEQLLKKGIIVRSMNGYDLPEYIRVTFGMPKENQKFIKTLRELLK